MERLPKINRGCYMTGLRALPQSMYQSTSQRRKSLRQGTFPVCHAVGSQVLPALALNISALGFGSTLCIYGEELIEVLQKHQVWDVSKLHNKACIVNRTDSIVQFVDLFED